jgi:long-subunit fatty acid transport protein
MIKNFIILIVLLISTTFRAQQASSSPYSFYGIGDVRFKGNAEARMMGGASVFADSIHMNFQNPASFAGIKLTTFTAGGSFNSNRLNAFKGNEKSQRTTLDYLMVAIPMKNSGFGFGLIPYSSVGYKIRNTDAVTNDYRAFEGTGGVNKVFVSYAYKFKPNFSVGLSAHYNFGQIETTTVDKISVAQLGTQEVNTSELSGFSLDLGAYYSYKINPKLDLSTSFVISPQTNMKSRNTRVISSVFLINGFEPFEVDQLDEVNQTNTLKLPSKYTFGVGIGQNKKWMLATEFTLQQSSNFGTRTNDLSKVDYENGFKYSLGGYYIPNYSSFANYFKKITYRAGFRYERTGMIINQERIRDYAISGGFGLPLGGAFSNLNLGVEWGRRGTAKALLIEENYTNVIISISLNDRWFIKRKYD